MADTRVSRLLAASLLLAAPACVGDEPPFPEDGDAAASAITLRVRASGFAAPSAELFRIFSERSGVAVAVEEVPPEELLAWGAGSGEGAAPDLLLARDASLLREAADRDLLVRSPSRRLEAAIPPDLRDGDGAWLGVGQWAVVVAYACDRVDGASLGGYTALADSAWAGRLALPDSGRALAAVLATRVAEFGEEAAAAWLGAVRENALGVSPDPAASVLPSGDADVALTATDRLAADLGPYRPEDARGGHDVCVAFPDQGGGGTHVRVAAAAVPARAARRDGGRRLLEFLASQEGQARLAQVLHLYPIRPDVPWPPRLLAWGDFRADALPATGLPDLDARAARLMAQPLPEVPDTVPAGDA